MFWFPFWIKWYDLDDCMGEIIHCNNNSNKSYWAKDSSCSTCTVLFCLITSRECMKCQLRCNAFRKAFKRPGFDYSTRNILQTHSNCKQFWPAQPELQRSNNTEIQSSKNRIKIAHVKKLGKNNIYDSKFEQYYNIMVWHVTTNSDKITWYHYILLLLSIFTMVIRNSQFPQNAT